MWMDELPNGKFKFTERYYDDKTGKNKKVSVTLASKSPQAKNKASKILLDRIDKKRESVDDMTVKEAVYKYIQYKSGQWAYATKVKNRGFYKRHIEPSELGSYLVTQASLSDFQAFFDDIDLTFSTLVNIKSLINQSLKFVKLNNGIDNKSHLEYITINRKEVKKKSKFIDSDQIDDTLKRVHDKLPGKYADMLEVQLLTGMRIGEVRALIETDWDEVNSTLSITKSIERHANNVTIPKTQSSIRVIDTNDRVNEIIKNRIKENKYIFKDKSNYIFASKSNGPLTYTYLASLLKKHVPYLTTHAMRHTHISLLAEKGFDIKYIMDRVGHSNPDTTLKVYSHVTKNNQKKQAEKLNNLI